MSFLSLRRGAARLQQPSLRREAGHSRPRRRRALRLERLEDRELLTVVQFDTTLGSFRVTLEDVAKPITVTNFLNYVTNNRYADSFIHRVAHITGVDVIQGGGFRFVEPGGVVDVQKDNAIQNEPGISNVRGTIAMAKTSNPNSATSQWFINVLDNHVALDNPANSGGFTVFGHVIGNGMAVVDAIAALPRVNLGSSLSELPVVNHSSGNVTGQNLVYTDVHVVSGDVAPTFSTIAAQTVHQGQTLTLDVPIADGDLPSELFQYSLTNSLVGATFQSLNNSTGRFTWTPPANLAPGQYQAMLRVTDLSGKTAEQTVNLTLTDDLPEVHIDDVPLTATGFNFSQFAVRFNEAVTGVDLGDLQLTRDGGANLLTGAQSLTSTDNALYTLGNLAGVTDAPGMYTLSVTATNSNIQDGTNQPLASGAVKSWRNVGTVTQSLIDNQSLTAEGTVYRITASISGGMTAEFSLDPSQGGVTSFRMIDPAGGTPPPANIAPDGSNGRIDYRMIAGQTVLLVVQGNHPNAALRISDLLELNDATKRATLHGLPGNDSMELHVDAGNLLIDFNTDLRYFFSPNDFETIVFEGGGGADRVTLSGSTGDDTADVFAGGGFLQGTTQVGAASKNFRFEVSQTELITVEGSGGDTLTLRGTAGDDMFITRPGQFSATGAAGFVSGRGFSTVNFIPGSGGSDRVVLYGGNDNDQLTVSPTGFSLSGPGYQAAIQGVTNLRAFAGQGLDSLTWNGGSDATDVMASPNQIVIRSGAFTGQFFGFERFTANKGLGQGTASWLDSAQAEVFVADPSMTRWSGAGFDFRTNNFNTVRAFASGGGDAAVFVVPGGSGAQFSEIPGVATLTTANSTSISLGFASVRGPTPAPPASAAAANSPALEALAVSLRLAQAANENVLSLTDSAFDEPEDWLS